MGQHEKKVRNGMIFMKVGLAITCVSLAMGGGLYLGDKVGSEGEPDTVQVVDAKEELMGKEDSASTNFTNSVISFLNGWVNKKGESVHSNYKLKEVPIDGVVAYPARVLNTDKTTTIRLGLDEVTLPTIKVTSYDGFLETVKSLEPDSKGLALARYRDGKISDIELYQLTSGLDAIQEVLSKIGNVPYQVDTKTKAESKTTDYAGVTAEEWKGMALLTSRDISSKGMAPVFVVPHSDILVKRDLQGTFYYIVNGLLESSGSKQTVLKNHEGKKINLDFEIKADERVLGKPVWIHLITQNGVIENVEVQPFEGSDIKVMSEGIRTYISTTAALETNE